MKPIDLTATARKIELIVDRQVDVLVSVDELNDKQSATLEKLAKILILLDERRLKEPAKDPFDGVSTSSLAEEFE